MATIKKIDTLVSEYSERLNDVAIKLIIYKARLFKLELWAKDVVGPLHRELQKAKDKLEDAISKSADLFIKPKTMTVHNVKFGIQKSKTVLEWDDEEELLLQIKKKFPKIQDLLIRTVEKPDKATLMQLSKADLKRLPLKVINGDNYVLVKPDDKKTADLLESFTNGKE